MVTAWSSNLVDMARWSMGPRHCLFPNRTKYPFFSAECTISLSPQEPGPICSSSIVLNCSSCDLRYVRFEEFAADGFRFDVLTSNYILRNPDYEEVVGEGFYELRIAHVERYNCTRYRCFGYVDTSKIFSNEWKLLIPCELL